MASLPSVLVANTLKLEPDLRKLPSSFPIEKRSYSTNTQLGKGLDPTSLDFREALSLITEGTSVESSIYVPLLQECIDRNSVSEAQVIHGHIVKTCTHEDLFLMTFLVNVYAKCGAMENARKVFDNLPKSNVVTCIEKNTEEDLEKRSPELQIIGQEELERAPTRLLNTAREFESHHALHAPFQQPACHHTLSHAPSCAARGRRRVERLGTDVRLTSSCVEPSRRSR
ncbi:hypothetical protein HYC85_023941 [Camellia sinensis]|uniref:Pentatricopeptide repeat-containing protein n=1 Tax=Camellia sinensis TaxID=4442 RepID=A0A7J7GFX9_CAMSI|nr:hypothetical protein HYC85_023941 [Camellia sinensis]